MRGTNRFYIYAFLLIIVSLAAGCGDVGTDKSLLVEEFMAALQTKDVEEILTFYAEDFTYLNVTILDWGEIALADYQRVLRSGYAANDGIFIADAYFLAPDQNGAALSGTYTAVDKNGNIAAVPMVMVIEIRDNKIIRQTDYLDGVRFIK